MVETVMVTSTGQENIRAGTRFLGMGIEGWGCSVLRANVFNHPKVSTERAFLPGGQVLPHEAESHFWLR